MRLISWNVNGRKDKVGEQAEALLGSEPEVVALQEVRRETVSDWTNELESEGFSAVSTEEIAGPRRNFLLVASRLPIVPTGAEIEIPFPELVLSVSIGDQLEIVATHVPNGVTYGIKKVEHFEGLYRYLVRRGRLPRILCGDLNAPRQELSNGETVTWAQRADGRVRKSRGQRWDAAERSVLRRSGRVGGEVIEAVG